MIIVEGQPVPFLAVVAPDGGAAGVRRCHTFRSLPRRVRREVPYPACRWARGVPCS